LWHLILPFCLFAANGLAEDARVQYGTRSMTAATRFEQGMEAFKQGDARRSLNLMDSAIASDPDFQLAYMWRGDSLQKLGRIDKAIEAYERVVELGGWPQAQLSVHGMINLGLLHGQVKQPDESLHWLTMAQMVDSEDLLTRRWLVLRNLAITLREIGRHQSAFLAVKEAYALHAEAVGEPMVREFREKATLEQAADQQAGQMLFLRTPATPPQATPSSPMTLVEIEGEIEGEIEALWSIPGDDILALTDGERKAYRIRTRPQKVTIEPLEFGSPIHAASVHRGRVFLLLGEPARIAQLDPNTWQLGQPVPAPGTSQSLAVLPDPGFAYLLVADQIIAVNLASGKTSPTQLTATGLAVDPTGRSVYAYIKPRRDIEQNTVFVNGRPIFVTRERGDPWSQSTLLQYAVGRSGRLLFAGMRLSAASNAYRVSISPDGRWVSLVGGGGWRPAAAEKSGYGAMVMPNGDLEKIQCFLPTESYSHDISFNPVTDQAAIVGREEIRAYHLGDPHDFLSVAKIEDDSNQRTFGYMSVWSSDGRTLLVAGDEAGQLHAYQQELKPKQQALAKQWYRDLVGKLDPLPGLSTSPAAGLGAKPVPWVAGFRPRGNEDVVKRTYKDALRQGNELAPFRYTMFHEYLDHPAASQVQAIADSSRPNQMGVTLYRFQQLEKDYADFAPLQGWIMQAYAHTGDFAKAAEHAAKVLRHDQGRTDLSISALVIIGKHHEQQGRKVESLDCVAAHLRLDRHDQGAIRRGQELIAQIEGRAPTRDTSANTNERPDATANLTPATATDVDAAPDRPAIAPETLFEQLCPSVVLIRNKEGTIGTGFCIDDRGLIVTNKHVLEGHQRVSVYCFEMQQDKPRRFDPTTGFLEYISTEHDLAFLRLRSFPKSLKPMRFADEPSRVGEKVIAIGNPGLGDQVLDLSLSEGIVSAIDRRVGEDTFIQHTAAINPGNSGGPLINARGQVIGVVTLKAKLENVGFALPPRTIQREIERGGLR
jgi:tetratricopeptide (TPR) repeat protein